MTNKKLSRKFKRSQIELHHIKNLNSEEQVYKLLCKRVITYLCDTFPKTIIIIKHHNTNEWGFPHELSVSFSNVHMNMENNYTCWESTYKEIYKQIIQFKFREHFIREEMSPEEVELQLSIRGY